MPGGMSTPYLFPIDKKYTLSPIAFATAQQFPVKALANNVQIDHQVKFSYQLKPFCLQWLHLVLGTGRVKENRSS